MSDDLTDSDRIAKAKREAAIYRTHGPGSGTPTEQWLEQLGAKFTDVWFRGRNGELFEERHVADPETIEETIRMSLDRHGGRAVAMIYHGRWCVYTPGARVRGTKVDRYRYYDSREAAEMVLIHNA